MTLQNISWWYFDLFANKVFSNDYGTAWWISVNEAGKSVGIIWKVYIEWRPASKTISAAWWGRIYWHTNSSVFSNASTTVRVWIQDVDAATGLEDGTFDVYKDLVWGTDTISSFDEQYTAMGTGSKTINHWDFVCILVEMISRWWTDSIQLRSRDIEDTRWLPYCTRDTGSWPSKYNNFFPAFMIEFDDWTLWWIDWWFGGFFPASSAQYSISTSLTYDEVWVQFKLPFKTNIIGCWLDMSVESWEGASVKLYSDPTGTPTALETLVIDPDITMASWINRKHSILFASEHTLEADTWYAITLLATTANNITMWFDSYPSWEETAQKFFPFGQDIISIKRDGSSGAFSELNSLYYPQWFWLKISWLDDWAWWGWWGWYSWWGFF